MLIQIIKSNRGGNIAVHNGYCYNQKQVTSSCIHWRCTKYYSIKCPAVLKTNQNVVISLKDSHTHESDPSECKAKEVVNQIKQKSESLTPTVAIASEISVISDDYAVQLSLPKKENLIRTVCRKRTVCFYGIWGKIRKCRNLNTFKRRLELFVPSAPVMKKIKKQMQVIQSGYNFENVLPHLRAVASFR